MIRRDGEDYVTSPNDDIARRANRNVDRVGLNDASHVTSLPTVAKDWTSG